MKDLYDPHTFDQLKRLFIFLWYFLIPFYKKDKRLYKICILNGNNKDIFFVVVFVFESPTSQT